SGSDPRAAPSSGPSRRSRSSTPSRRAGRCLPRICNRGVHKPWKPPLPDGALRSECVHDPLEDLHRSPPLFPDLRDEVVLPHVGVGLAGVVQEMLSLLSQLAVVRLARGDEAIEFPGLIVEVMNSLEVLPVGPPPGIAGGVFRHLMGAGRPIVELAGEAGEAV